MPIHRFWPNRPSLARVWRKLSLNDLALVLTVAGLLALLWREDGSGFAHSHGNGMLTGDVTRVRDGDTIEVRGVPVRLNGIAAPELDEPHGRRGRAFMRDLVLGKTVACTLTGEQSHDREIGLCTLDGDDIGARIVRAGLARDCPRYSGGRYRDAETARSRALSLPRYC